MIKWLHIVAVASKFETRRNAHHCQTIQISYLLQLYIGLGSIGLELLRYMCKCLQSMFFDVWMFVVLCMLPFLMWACYGQLSIKCLVLLLASLSSYNLLCWSDLNFA